jgi:hypothetical protein
MRVKFPIDGYCSPSAGRLPTNGWLSVVIFGVIPPPLQEELNRIITIIIIPNEIRQQRRLLGFGVP